MTVLWKYFLPLGGRMLLFSYLFFSLKQEVEIEKCYQMTPILVEYIAYFFLYSFLTYSCQCITLNMSVKSY